MSGRIWRAIAAAGLGAALTMGGAVAVAKISLPHFSGPHKKEPVTLDTLLGQVKVKLIGQATMSYVLTERDHKGAEVDTPQTHAITYTDVSWADRCVLKVKESSVVQDNVDEAFRRDHTDEATIDLHGLKPLRAVRYADYLTHKDVKASSRFSTDPHGIWAIPAGDTVLIAMDHDHAAMIIHELDRAAKMCAAEKPPA
ncbi:MAG TPA: hypothetical protein VG407_07535 [Caulobacteraceae bacterium]|jgi:hypothetical protein|nr:hypothetical protein [Caulobacteraceae bacterium]